MSLDQLLKVGAHDCQDCLSEFALVHLDDNVHMLQILHDDTCPTYAQMEADK